MRRKCSLQRSLLSALSLTALLVYALAQVRPSVRSAVVRRQQEPSAALPTNTASPTPSSTPRAALPVRPPQQSRRDLARYATAGPFVIADDGLPAAREQAVAQARTFLLEHWRNRRHAQVVIHGKDAAGAVTTSALYVETDDAGRWCVVLEAGGKTERYGVVEEIEFAEDGTPILEPETAGGRRPSGRHGLHLKQSAEDNSGLIL